MRPLTIEYSPWGRALSDFEALNVLLKTLDSDSERIVVSTANIIHHANDLRNRGLLSREVNYDGFIEEGNPYTNLLKKGL